MRKQLYSALIKQSESTRMGTIRSFPKQPDDGTLNSERPGLREPD